MLEYTKVTLVNVREMLTAKYVTTRRACPLEVKPGTFRTRRFLTFLVEVQTKTIMLSKLDSSP